MFGWIQQYPAVSRIAVLSLGLAATVRSATVHGAPLDWEQVIIFGVTMGLSTRWPLILPATGTGVILLGGLFFHSMWDQSLPPGSALLTGIAVLLVSQLVRMAHQSRTRNYLNWPQFFIIWAAFFTSYGLYQLIGISDPLQPWFPPTHLAAVVHVYAYWTIAQTGAVLKRQASGTWLDRIKWALSLYPSTWWVPLVFLTVAYIVQLAHLSGLPLLLPACVALLWLQSRIGPAFTPFFQDWAVSRLLSTAPDRSVVRSGTQYRLIRVAVALGRAANLSANDLRELSYAALLVDLGPRPHPSVPRWLLSKPDAQLMEHLRHHISDTMAWLNRESALFSVSRLVQLRYATYNGEGFPSVEGDGIMLPAGLLTAANAIIMVEEEQRVVGGVKGAAQWLCATVPERFDPRVLQAMRLIYTDETISFNQGLPETVRQLRGLVQAASRTAPLGAALQRIFAQVRGSMPLVPELPREVQGALQMGTIFAASTDAHKTAQVIVEAIGQLVDGRVLLGFLERDEQVLRLHSMLGYNLRHLNLTGRVVDIQTGVVIRNIMNPEPFQVSDIRELHSPFVQDLANEEGIRSMLLVPLISRGRPIGLLAVGMTAYHWFTPREVGLIHLMSNQGAIALENAMLIAEEAERSKRLAELKQFTDTLVDRLSPAILVFDPDCRLRMANAAARSLLGAQYEPKVGEELPPELLEMFPVTAVLAGRPLPEKDWPFANRILEVQASPLYDSDGALLGAVCMARDVTHVREMENQVRRVEKLAAIGEMAAGAAHEIRNPLTSMKGFIQLIQSRGGELDHEYCQIVLNEIDRIDAIIRDLLLLARPAEGQRTVVSLAHLVDDVMKLQASSLVHQGIGVVREFHPDTPPVQVDPKLIRQLLLNLVLNAAQAMPEGGLLTLNLRPGSVGEVVLEVHDTGFGIAPENMNRLFVPFFTTRDGGTGLGLALCYSIVQAHQGRMDVSSKVGVGTTFTVSLPVVPKLQ